MKKKYVKAQIKMSLGTETELLQTSGVTGDTPDGTIGYGGVDEEGTKDPESKPFTLQSVWDE